MKIFGIELNKEKAAAKKLRDEFTAQLSQAIYRGDFDREGVSSDGLPPDLMHKIRVFAEPNPWAFNDDLDEKEWEESFYNAWRVHLTFKAQEESERNKRIAERESEATARESAHQAIVNHPVHEGLARILQSIEHSDRRHLSPKQIPLSETIWITEPGHNKKGIVECRTKLNQLLFERKNSAYKITSELGILAALQDAQNRAQRGIEISGGDNFKHAVALVAAQHNFNILSADVLKMIEKERAEIKEEVRTEAQQAVVEPDSDSEIATLSYPSL